VRYSFMSFSCPDLSLDEMIAVARNYGYDGIEPRITSGHKHGIEPDSPQAFRKECARKAADNGIALSCVATSCRYADPETTREMTDDTRRAIDLAGDVGAPRLRVFGGPIPEGVTREAATDLLADAMRAVADHAAARAVAVCVETHDHWCDPKHMAEVMTRVNHPAIGVNWDIMHPVRVAKVTMDEAFETLQPWIRHVHFHDGVSEPDGGITLKRIGEGQIDHRRAVQLLEGAGYADFLSGEWINWEPYETHLPRELAAMKQFESGSP